MFYVCNKHTQLQISPHNILECAIIPESAIYDSFISILLNHIFSPNPYLSSLSAQTPPTISPFFIFFATILPYLCPIFDLFILRPFFSPLLLSLTHTHTHSLQHNHILSHAHSPSLPCTQFRTYTQTHTDKHIHTHINTRIHTLSLSLTPTHSLTHSLSHTHSLAPLR